MSREEKSLFDATLDDITAALEIDLALKASRDRNGKADKWKATGIAMGMGHTSDFDIAMMGAMLGAEGAFDDDTDSFGGNSYGVSTPITPAKDYTRSSFRTEHTMTEEEYESKKADIIANKKSIIAVSVFAMCLFTFLFFYIMVSCPESCGACVLLMTVSDALLGYSIYRASQSRKRELALLENEYRISKQREEEKKKAAQAKKKSKGKQHNKNRKPSGTKIHSYSTPTVKGAGLGDNEGFEDTFIGNNLVAAEDMQLLNEAGYDSFDLEMMDSKELKETMQDAGVNTYFYDFE